VNGDDPIPPAAEDDFPEFAEPPRYRPSPEALEPRASEPEADDAQREVDDVIARLRRERAKGQR
jgi:hypothetical protein